MIHRTSSAVLLSLCLSPLAAQTRFAENAKEHFPRRVWPTQGIAMGDVDGDGDLDVVLANYSLQNRLWLNLGRGVFTDATTGRMPVNAEHSLAVALADMDGDGSLDIVFVNYQQQNRLYLNDGRGYFTDVSATKMPAIFDPVTSLAIADVDGDRDMDLVIGCDGGQTRLYLNDGRGTFTDRSAGRMPVGNYRTNGVAFADVDGDGQPDLILANYQQPSRLYMNRSLGTFVDESATRMATGLHTCTSVAVGDVNGDRAIDIVLGATGERKRLYLNDGRGNFSDQSSRVPPETDPTLAVQLADFDRDGDLDLLVGNCGTPYGQQNRYYANDGQGNFGDVTATRMPVDSDYTTSLAIGDVDRDGDLDVAVGNSGPWWQQSRLYLNEGSGAFLDSTADHVPQYKDITRAVVLADVDGDACLDVLFGNRGSQSRLHLGNRKTGFDDATAAWMPQGADLTHALAVGDVDGDGRPDLFVGNHTAQTRLCINTGRAFVDATTSRMPAVSTDMTTGLALGDVDGDGDLDLVIGNYSQQTRLYLNDGRGTFADATSRLPAQVALTACVLLADLDGDRDLDLLLGNHGQKLLYLNDGTGRFTDATAARLPADNDFTSAVAAGDVDRDGDLDLVLGNAPQDRLYLNDGTGKFTDATPTKMPVDNTPTLAVALGDVDDDGDLDLVNGNDHQQNRLFLNDGRGTFSDATLGAMPVYADPTAGVALGDIDRDGDLDIVFANHGPCVFFCNPQVNRLYLNLRRQIHTPLVARTRETLRLEVTVNRGTSPLPGLAIPFFSAAELHPHLRVPMLGFLGVDLVLGAPGPAIVANGPGDSGTFSFVLPDDLAGVTLYTQAVMLHSANPGDWRLGNILADRIIR